MEISYKYPLVTQMSAVREYKKNRRGERERERDTEREKLNKTHKQILNPFQLSVVQRWQHCQCNRTGDLKENNQKIVNLIKSYVLTVF